MKLISNHSNAVSEHPALQDDKTFRYVVDDSDNDEDGDDSKVEIPAVAKKTDEEVIINDKDKRAVRNVKFIVFFVLLISIAGAVAIYLYMKNSEQTQFEISFNDDANKVLGSIGNSIEKAFGALDNMAVTLANIAQITDQEYPFVTIPQYGLYAAKSMPLTKGICTYVLPVVRFDQRMDWEQYAARNNTHLSYWVEEELALQENWSGFYGPLPQNYSWSAHDTVYTDFGDLPYNTTSRSNRLDVMLPEWQRFPLVMGSYYPANWDWYSVQYPEAMTRVMDKKMAAISQTLMIPRKDNPNALIEAQIWCEYNIDFITPGTDCFQPLSTWYYPIVVTPNPSIELDQSSAYPDNVEVKAVIAVEFYWHNLFRDILPSGSKGIILVVENACVEDAFTYQIDGPLTTYLGVGDYHNPKYNRMSISSAMFDLVSYKVGASDYTGLPVDRDTCMFNFLVYASDDMADQYQTSNGVVFALAAFAFIIFPFLIFLIYDRMVSRQQKQIISSAQKSNAIISDLFPSHVRDQLYKPNDGDELNRLSNGPIAELYPETTILFADMVNFTSWSSVRDPYQVFKLLESVYGKFDEAAERRRIFKVETVGDCYVAVTGLPEPRRDHAVVMARYAKEILSEMAIVTAELETHLGPGTGALTIRIGLNSGPTTAGVLRGSKGRFQVFGDTVNTAARMESNSKPGRIMCSQKTSDLLIAAGKPHWVSRRTDMVDAKGKGQMVCYWCNPKNAGDNSSSGTNSVESKNLDTMQNQHDDVVNEVSMQKYVNWMTEMFDSMLIDVVKNRDCIDYEDIPMSTHFGSPRDEVSETIILPKRKEKLSTRNIVSFEPIVKSQLEQYITDIALLYQKNAFHNFDHACHVVMATRKLLSRVVKPNTGSVSATAYGITSDPLTQFAIVFSALIHDVDHPGVSNAQLVKEETEVATFYNNKSVAEQNSITISWNLLMQSKFNDLRKAFIPTEMENKHFRQLLVNAVMATDLFDADLKRLRENRWHKVFHDDINDDNNLSINDEEDSNRRATIVIEHIIQASDVSHTMQHWHVYQKWNRKLLREMYEAYQSNRSDKDPTIGWYEGELWFFDNYIIPLAKKLKTCGVFGVSCDELLDYAVDNRAEWAAKGRDIVVDHIASLQQQQQPKSSSQVLVSSPPLLGSLRLQIGNELGQISAL